MPRHEHAQNPPTSHYHKHPHKTYTITYHVLQFLLYILSNSPLVFLTHLQLVNPRQVHTHLHTHTHTFRCVIFSNLFVFCFSELANLKETLEESKNKRVVLALYEALSSRDVDTVHKVLASDLEWWFHGPPSHQFMMRLLTGTATSSSSTTKSSDNFDFVPQTVVTFGSTVLVEGCDHERNITWVHAWTVSDGIITQVREYFNTALTVTRFSNTDQSSPSDYSSITPLHCPSIWESSLSNRVGKSVPGLVLAI